MADVRNSGNSPLTEPRRVELWQRVEGGNGAFTWAVWRDDNTAEGYTLWFTTEDEARAEYARLRGQAVSSGHLSEQAESLVLRLERVMGLLCDYDYTDPDDLKGLQDTLIDLGLEVQVLRTTLERAV